MASGKSTVGPRVAARVGYTFVDVDRLIRAHEGRSIPEIFTEDGESEFRSLETEALRMTAERENLVVALGGGALVDPDNRSFAKTHGDVVYLEVDVDTILGRVQDEADHRPLLQDKEGTPLSSDGMRERISEMLEDRRSTYEEAHHTVDASRPVDDVVADVTSLVSEPAR